MRRGDEGGRDGGPAVAERGKEALRLWLRLLGSTTMIEQHLKTRLRERFDVTLAQFDLMAEIARGGEPRTMSQISELLMVSNGNVTGVVDRLSREGLVQRTPSTEDRRAYLISLTPAGRERFERMAREHERWLEELLEELDPEVVRRLGRDVKTLRDELRRRTGKGSP